MRDRIVRHWLAWAPLRCRPTSLRSLRDTESPPLFVEDLYARRRAGAHDAELVNLLSQQDRGGLDGEQARALVDELPVH